MTPDQLPLVDDLEHQLAQLRRIRERLRSTDRVRPGTSTFWTGPARAAYELLVDTLTDALERTDDALGAAIVATSTSLGTLRRG